MSGADCDGKGVGDIIRLGRLVKVEELSNHIDDLLLNGTAITGDGLLNLLRRALQNINAILGGSQQDDTTRLADWNRSSDVAAEVQLFNAYEVGLVLLNERVDLIVNLFKAVLHTCLSIGRDGTILQRTQKPAGIINQPIAADRGARINT